MADYYIVGVVGLVASLLGFVFSYYNSLVTRFEGKKKLKKNASMEIPNQNCVNKTGNTEPAATKDVIIVGAGVAGAALAYSLGKDGRRVHVIERDLNPHQRIAGENLLPGGYLKLVELGLEDCVEEIDAQPNLGYVLYRDGKEATIAYNAEKNISGKSFRNGRFVQKLRERAASLHSVSLEQGTVTSLLEENGTVKGVHYKNKNGQVLTAYAPLTVVCDGCFSNLRRSLCYPKIDVPSHCVGIELTDCKLPLENYGALIVTHPSCFSFYPISSNEIRCMVEVIGPNLPSVKDGEMVHYLKTHVAPKVPPEMHNAFMTAIEKKDNIKTMPHRIMAASPHPTPGAILIGDALNMRHAVVGGGMTVALSDVVLLRDLLRPLSNLSDGSAVCEYLESFYALRKPMSSTINVMGNAIQKVFGDMSDPAMADVQEACFEYFRLGGVFSFGISALSSGLRPRPSTLALHLCAMAIYGVGRLLLPFPSPRRIWNAAKFLWVAARVIFPLLESEGVRQMFFPFTVPAYYRTPPSNKDINA